MHNKKNISSIDIGKTIRSIRENKGLKQKEIMDALPYKCHLSKVEQNNISLPFNTIIDILEILNISMDEFIEIGNNFSFPLYKTLQTKMNTTYFQVTKIEMKQYLHELEQHIHSNCNISETSTTNLLYCKMMCFYYLNFENNLQKAKPYYEVIISYLFSKIFSYSIHDIELTIIAFAFCSYEEAEVMRLRSASLIEQASAQGNNELHSRFLLSYIKNMFINNKTDYIPQKLQELEQQLNRYSAAKFRAEFLILKGIVFIELGKRQNIDSLQGYELLSKGLTLAKENNEILLHKNWSYFCEHYFAI